MASSSVADGSTESHEHKQPLIINQPTPVIIAAGPTKVFDANIPEYRCCCGCMHLRHGAIAIGIFQLVCAVFNFGQFFAAAHSHHSLLLFINAMIHVPILICLIIGAAIQNRYLLIPYMLYTIVDIIISIAIFALAVVYSIKFNYVAIAVIYGFACVCGIALALWFTWVIYKCYGYFRERQAQLASGAVIIGQP
uniref:MARVEL domain-containing protein n=1 Tax=Panagrolaimus sp. ES5 TaxID=591445 RepID=A0AC34FVJ5_9BILA